jgi:hypothetical protein
MRIRKAWRQKTFLCKRNGFRWRLAPTSAETAPSIIAIDEGASIMSPKDILAQIGKGPVKIEPARCEAFGVWRIRFIADGRALRDLEVFDAKRMAEELRHKGNRLLATRIEIGIEQARRKANSETRA